jgi:hypothetical protein
MKIVNRTNTILIIEDNKGSYVGTLGPHQSMILLPEQYKERSNVLEKYKERGFIEILKDNELPEPIPVEPKIKRTDASVSYIKRHETEADVSDVVSAVKGGPDMISDDEFEDAGSQIVKSGGKKGKMTKIVGPKKPIVTKASKEELALDTDDASMIIPSDVPGKAKIKPVDQLVSEDLEALAKETNARLAEAARHKRFFQVLTNYDGWSQSQRLQYIKNSDDADLLKELLNKEKSAVVVASLKKRIKSILESE